MQITFVSNYINHHQLPMSEALSELTGGNYTFIQTEPISGERVKMGWNANADEQDFVKKYYEEPDACRKLIMDSDVVISGGIEDESYVMERLLAGKFTIRYSESIYKEGRWKFITPRGLIRKYKEHIRFRNYPVYMLCSGAYVAGDFHLIGAYPGKMLKFGYFPRFVERAGEELDGDRDDNLVNILWVGRMIDWKHPEAVIGLAKRLADAGIDYKLTMIGRGELGQTVEEMISREGLGDRVTVIESMTPKEVRGYMRKADILVATSDRREGWGAVVNEAMNEGCAVVVSHEEGCATFLINDCVNGFIYRNGDMDDLLDKTTRLCESKDLRRRLGHCAYQTIRDTWNARIAASRLIDFINDPKHEIHDYEDNGPLSKAPILSPKKWRQPEGNCR